MVLIHFGAVAWYWLHNELVFFLVPVWAPKTPEVAHASSLSAVAADYIKRPRDLRRQGSSNSSLELSQWKSGASLLVAHNSAIAITTIVLYDASAIVLQSAAAYDDDVAATTAVLAAATPNDDDDAWTTYVPAYGLPLDAAIVDDGS